jgi:transcriptional regulator with XRE-family HTH domain
VNLKYEELLIFIGNQIRQKRLERNLTQFDLASLIDCEIKSIQRIEKGQMNMSLKMFLSISEVLEITPDELLMNQEFNNNDSKGSSFSII